ncbi:UNKNOWN [Stylonychia lemnae]|uniref:MRH domain-containing protein n=1 Tax=Stylonychia lemnae TaxID=5949 RepID=A0A078B3A0_STYLE|nr:UNKNOWN [Stylonychia lemnae]|eukprot:CDW88741.1 UNKNOWN [Stylonychia lemnae]
MDSQDVQMQLKLDQVMNHQILMLYLAYFFYDNNDLEDVCDATSQLLPQQIYDLDCSIACPAGEYLDLDPQIQSSKCSLCPANTYSLPGGLLIDGVTGDWINIKNEIEAQNNTIPIDFECFYENQNYQWISNTNCEPWIATQKSIKGGKSVLMNANVAFKITLTSYFEQNATVEFRYKKQTNQGLFSNGEFKFVVNGQKILVDYDYTKSDWITFKYNITDGPGKYTLIWIYSKYNDESGQNLMAEIEYISIVQHNMPALECLPCKRGQSQPGSSRCSLCKANYYSDSETRECKKCPDGKYSYAGAIGDHSCIPKQPCSAEDVYSVYSGECGLNQQRSVSYQWYQPKICDDQDPNSIDLPESKNIPCRNCQRGQFENKSTGYCEYCPKGFYQDVDYHNNSTQTGASECKQCPAGHAAPLVLEYDHFEKVPEQFSKVCESNFTTNVDLSDVCDRYIGWKTTANHDILVIDQPLPSGFKSILETKVEIIDDLFGQLTVDFSVKDFQLDSEKFSIEIDGISRYETTIESDNTNKIQSILLYLPSGQRKIQLIYENMKQLSFVLDNEGQLIIQNQTQGVLSIHKIQIQGTSYGGAVACHKCQDGYVTSQSNPNTCDVCGYGFEPNQDQSACQGCVDSYFNNIIGGNCRKCPAYTTSRAGSSQYNYYLLSTIMVCNKQMNMNYCDNNIMGPIFPESSSNYNQDVFFISNFSKNKINKLNIERFDLRQYEYHETQDSVRFGHIFALFHLNQATMEEFKNEQAVQGIVDQSTQCLSQLKTFKLKKVVGQIVQNITNFTENGYSIYFEEGDMCDKKTNTRYSSQIDYVCRNDTDEEGYPTYKYRIGKCHYVFEWVSTKACSQCKLNQVKQVVSNCENGKRYISNIPIDKCIIEFTDNEYLTINNNDSPLALRHKFVVLTEKTEECQIKDDFLINPMLQGLLIFISIFFTLFFIGTICFYRKYRNLKVRYQKLSEDDNGGGEIEMQQTK